MNKKCDIKIKKIKNNRNHNQKDVMEKRKRILEWLTT